MAKADRKQASKPGKHSIANFSQEEFDKAVESHPRAKRALALMMGQGRSGQKILALLRAHVEQEYMPKSFAAVRRQTGLSRKQIDTMARVYERAAHEIARLIEYGRLKSDDPKEQSRLYRIFPPALLHLAAASPAKRVTTSEGRTISIEEGFDLLPELLKNFSIAVKSWPNERARSGQFDTQYGKNLCLFCAASLARKAIGRPCYPDLAALIEAFLLAVGIVKTVEPGQLEKVAEAFKRRYPDDAARHEEATWMHE
jgi:hypothetical protein